MHEGSFRYPSSCRGSLATELAWVQCPFQIDRKALENPYCHAGYNHVHLCGAYGFQDTAAVFFIHHLLQRAWFFFFLVMIKLRHMLWPEMVTECTRLLFQFPEGTFNPEPVTVKPDHGQRIKRKAGACQDAAGAVHLHQHKHQFLIQPLPP